jgi:hypothetical protein
VDFGVVEQPPDDELHLKNHVRLKEQGGKLWQKNSTYQKKKSKRRERKTENHCELDKLPIFINPEKITVWKSGGDEKSKKAEFCGDE